MMWYDYNIGHHLARYFRICCLWKLGNQYAIALYDIGMIITSLSLLEELSGFLFLGHSSFGQTMWFILVRNRLIVFYSS